MQANELPVVGQALSPANRNISQTLTVVHLNVARADNGA
jgi:hypothetical protein